MPSINKQQKKRRKKKTKADGTAKGIEIPLAKEFQENQEEQLKIGTIVKSEHKGFVVTAAAAYFEDEIPNKDEDEFKTWTESDFAKADEEYEEAPS